MTAINIGTASELQAFATRVNAGETTLDAVLTADINLTGITWIPIGTSTHPYAGTFDGNGKTVSNLSDVLIGYFSNGYTVHNIQITDTTLTISTNGHALLGSNPSMTGTLTANNIAVSNCHITTSSNYIGVVFGLLRGGTISNVSVCNSSIISSGTGITGVISAFAGGATNHNIVIECDYIKDTSTGSGTVSAQNSVVVYNCVFEGPTFTVISPMDNIGRIAGTNGGSATASNCYALSTLTKGSKYNGIDVSISDLVSESWWKTSSNWNSTYAWDWDNTWYWDSTDNLPKLQIFKPIPSVNISDGTTWSNGTPYVYDTEWLQGEKIHVYISSGWTEKV